MKKRNNSNLIIFLPFLLLTGLAILLNSGCASAYDSEAAGVASPIDNEGIDEIWVFSLENNKTPEKATLCEDFGNITLDNGEKIEAESTSISGEVTLLSADLSIKNSYRNPLNSKTGAVYELKYSSAALVTGFILTIGDKQIRAVITESKDAERIYAMAKRQGLRASIAKSKKGIFRQKIENIPANANFATQTDLTYFPPLKDNKFYLNIGSGKAEKRKLDIDLTFSGSGKIEILNCKPNIQVKTSVPKTTIKKSVAEANRYSVTYKSFTLGKLLFFDANHTKKGFFAFFTNKEIAFGEKDKKDFPSVYRLQYPNSDYSWIIGEYQNGTKRFEDFAKKDGKYFPYVLNSPTEKLWAGTRISTLILRKNNREEIVDLSIKNQILTPFTSFLAIDASGE